LIPCWSQPALQIGPFTLYAHGILLAFGTLVASIVFVNRAHAFSLGKGMALRFILVLAPIGLLASHLMYSIFDDPGSLFQLQGISSLGGILACLLGLAVGTFGRRQSGWRWFDAASYAAICGALIARLGCFLAHDRIGLPTSSWLSVKCIDGPHYDLALFEIVFLAICLGLLIWLAQRGWRSAEGMVFAVLAASYGLLRVILGQMREAPQRYIGLAPEQWGAAILVLAGAFCWLVIKQTAREASTPLFTKRYS
jgi:prolipoprotein diacylglyceryltransferase